MEFLEKLAVFAHQHFGAEMIKAREGYFQSLGIVHESDELYEEAMKAYLDWFLFERPIAAEGLTPVSLFIEGAVQPLPPEDAEFYRDLANSARRSLFIIKKVTDDAVDCKDLFSKSKFSISEENPKGFMKGEIFEARTFTLEKTNMFGDLLRFHPPRANKAIIKATKVLNDCSSLAAKDLMMKIAVCKIKHYRFPRIDLLQFYSEALQ
jgi:hypothetical protein